MGSSDQGWRTQWIEHLGPVRLTERVAVAPAHVGAEEMPAVEFALRLEAELAFGFGEHPSTRLAARLLADLVTPATDSVLDVGCGTGVLALVAAAHGAVRCHGLDVDPACVASARRNAEHNSLAQRCRFSRAPLSRVARRFDVVVANIELSVLRELSADLSGCLAPRGALVLAGFLVEDESAVCTRFALEGLATAARVTEDDWLALTFRRSSR